MITDLTRRERQVLQHLVDGHSPREISAIDYVSLFTVRAHIRHLRKKLGVNSYPAAVAVAARHGWTPTGEESEVA